MQRVRPAVQQDTPAIHRLIALVYAEYGCTLNVAEDEPHLIEPCSYFRGRGGEFWVVEEADAVAETGEIKATVAVLLEGRASELKSLYVHPSLRRQGLGRRLTEMAMERARAGRATSMFLWSDTRFLDAHNLYRRLGFREMGRRELHDTNNSIELGFEISLVPE